MARIKRSVTSRARRKKVIRMAAGYRGRAKTNFRVALPKVEKGLKYAYRDRRNRKRSFRALWIQRINAGAREHGVTYAELMSALRKAGLTLNRKVLADLAARDPGSFKALVDEMRAAAPPRGA
ncbi:MAG: 50S ribosomal protein L20 [Alphaproteobacteria bacterium]